jgi:hypothetical protein
MSDQTTERTVLPHERSVKIYTTDEWPIERGDMFLEGFGFIGNIYATAEGRHPRVKERVILFMAQLGGTCDE